MKRGGIYILTFFNFCNFGVDIILTMHRIPRLEKITSSVRETTVSRHNRGLIIKGPPYTLNTIVL